jgi:hypothetical protein
MRNSAAHSLLLDRILSRGELDAGVRRNNFWNTDVSPRCNDPTLYLRFPALPSPSSSATVAAHGDTGCSDLKCSSFSNVSRTGEDLKAISFEFAPCSLNVTAAGRSLVKWIQTYFQTICPIGLEEGLEQLRAEVFGFFLGFTVWRIKGGH